MALQLTKSERAWMIACASARIHISTQALAEAENIAEQALRDNFVTRSMDVQLQKQRRQRNAYHFKSGGVCCCRSDGERSRCSDLQNR